MLRLDAAPARAAAPSPSSFAALLLLATILTGGLGAPFGADEVPFDQVRREHFDAVAVEHQRAAPSPAPLVVRVRLLGDGSDAGRAWLDDADAGSRGGASPRLPQDDAAANPFAWLERHANVRVVPDPEGAPLYLPRGDLSATSGRSTLGATLRAGMAAEVGRPDVAPCIVAHEMLHFLGLHHVTDAENLMHPNCATKKLSRATLSPEQTAHLDGLALVRAATPRGVETWAARA